MQRGSGPLYPIGSTLPQATGFCGAAQVPVRMSLAGNGHGQMAAALAVGD